MAGICLPNGNGDDGRKGEFLSCPSDWPLTPEERKKREKAERALGLTPAGRDTTEDTARKDT